MQKIIPFETLKDSFTLEDFNNVRHYYLYYNFRNEKDFSFKILAKIYDVTPRTMRNRIKKSDKPKHFYDVAHWEKYGTIADKDIDYFFSEYPKDMRNLFLENCPKFYKEIRPDWFKFVHVFLGARTSVKDTEMIEAIDSVVKLPHLLSRLYLYSKQNKYDLFIQEIEQYNFKFTFSKDKLWQNYKNEGQEINLFIFNLMQLGLVIISKILTFKYSDLFSENSITSALKKIPLNNLSKNPAKLVAKRRFKDILFKYGGTSINKKNSTDENFYNAIDDAKISLDRERVKTKIHGKYTDYAKTAMHNFSKKPIAPTKLKEIILCILEKMPSNFKENRNTKDKLFYILECIYLICCCLDDFLILQQKSHTKISNETINELLDSMKIHEEWIHKNLNISPAEQQG